MIVLLNFNEDHEDDYYFYLYEEGIYYGFGWPDTDPFQRVISDMDSPDCPSSKEWNRFGGIRDTKVCLPKELLL